MWIEFLFLQLILFNHIFIAANDMFSYKTGIYLKSCLEIEIVSLSKTNIFCTKQIL